MNFHCVSKIGGRGCTPDVVAASELLPSLTLLGHGKREPAASAGSPARHEEAFLSLSRKLLCFFRHEC